MEECIWCGSEIEASDFFLIPDDPGDDDGYLCDGCQDVYEEEAVLSDFWEAA